jgi:hypothetical protein
VHEFVEHELPPFCRQFATPMQDVFPVEATAFVGRRSEPVHVIA